MSSKNGVEKSSRTLLMKSFQAVLYSKSEEECKDNIEKLEKNCSRVKSQAFLKYELLGIENECIVYIYKAKVCFERIT